MGSYIPNGPVTNQIFSLECFDSELYVCHGGHTNFGNWNNKNGASIKARTGFWNNYNYYDLDNAKDIVSVAKHNNNIYFSSFYNGVAQIKDGEFFSGGMRLIQIMVLIQLLTGLMIKD